MPPPNVQTTQTLDSSKTFNQVARNKRTLYRIMSWKPKKVEIKKNYDTYEAASEEIKQQALDTANEIKTQAVAGIEAVNRKDVTLGQKNVVATSVTQQAFRDVEGVKKDAHDFQNEYKNCIPPTSAIITLEVRAVPFEVYRGAIQRVTTVLSKARAAGGSAKGRRVARRIFGDSIFTKEIEKKAELVIRDKVETFTINYNGAEVYDFYIDPEKTALEVTVGVPPESANPKLVNYDENFRKTILDTEAAAVGNKGVTKDEKDFSDEQVINKTIDEIKNTFKSKIKKSKAYKKVESLMKNKAKGIFAGEASLELGDKTRGESSNKNKNKKKKAGSQFLETKVGLAALKMNKFYKNLSQKVWYKPQPFSFEFKGWKPNILGKWFDSNNVTGVKTWNRALGQLGDKAIMVAGMAALLKGFEYTLEKSGIEERLEEYAKEAREQNNEKGLPKSQIARGGLDSNNVIDSAVNIFDKSTGQNTKSDIDEFIRRN